MPPRIHYAQANSAEEIRPAFNRLMDLLETGRPGGAVLEIPQRVLVGPAERIGDLPARPKHAAVDARSLDEAASLLSKAKRPVIVAGRPIVAAGAEAALLQLAEKLGAPVFADRNAKGALPEDHPLALGFTWSPTSVAEDLMREADVVLAIGPREHAATGTRSPEQIGQTLIHLDWDAASQDDGAPARLKLAGHVGDALGDLVELVQGRDGPAFPTGGAGRRPRGAVALRRGSGAVGARLLPRAPGGAARATSSSSRTAWSASGSSGC